jgi:Spy/CpxP family protein refolding chaperone
MEALKSYLGLTDAQVEQMRTLRKQRAEEMQAQSAKVRAKALELRQLVQSASPDAAKVGALTLELKQLRETTAASRSGLSDQVKAILTADQKAKLAALEEAVKLGPAARQAVALGLVDAP